jgi:hypothetical protein
VRVAVTGSFSNGRQAVVRAAVSVTGGRFVAPTLATAVVPALVLPDAAGQEVGRCNAAAIGGHAIEPSRAAAPG